MRQILHQSTDDKQVWRLRKDEKKNRIIVTECNELVCVVEKLERDPGLGSKGQRVLEYVTLPPETGSLESAR